MCTIQLIDYAFNLFIYKYYICKHSFSSISLRYNHTYNYHASSPTTPCIRNCVVDCFTCGRKPRWRVR